MSRHDYSEDLDSQDLAMWRGRVMSAIRGKRGQRLLIDLREALDAMPEKRLITRDLQTNEGVCALGAVGVKRGVDMTDLVMPDPEGDPSELNEDIAQRLDIAECMVREIEYENDDFTGSPEKRWEYMRRWAEKHIKQEAVKP